MTSEEQPYIRIVRDRLMYANRYGELYDDDVGCLAGLRRQPLHNAINIRRAQFHCVRRFIAMDYPCDLPFEVPIGGDRSRQSDSSHVGGQQPELLSALGGTFSGPVSSRLPHDFQVRHIAHLASDTRLRR